MALTDPTEVVIHDFQESEPLVLDKVLDRLRQHQHVAKATIWCSARKPSGWLEYLMVINYRDSGSLTVGCIERERGSGMEFHT